MSATHSWVDLLKLNGNFCLLLHKIFGFVQSRLCHMPCSFVLFHLLILKKRKRKGKVPFMGDEKKSNTQCGANNSLGGRHCLDFHTGIQLHWRPSKFNE